jgi:pyruvate dehydrogenase E1 component
MAERPDHGNGARRADIDPEETREWLDAVEAVIAVDGPERAEQLLAELQQP